MVRSSGFEFTEGEAAGCGSSCGGDAFRAGGVTAIDWEAAFAAIYIAEAVVATTVAPNEAFPWG